MNTINRFVRNLFTKEEQEMHWEWKFDVHNPDGSLASSTVQKNLIPTVAKAAQALQITGLNTQNIGQNIYIALGTSITAPTTSDTQLGAEVIRKLVTVKSTSTNVASIVCFFSQTEATGTWREFGMFQNGGSTVASGSANTGIMFSKVPTNITVLALQTLTVTVTYTFP